MAGPMVDQLGLGERCNSVAVMLTAYAACGAVC